MIWLIAKKELYDNWQTHKIKLAFVLCSLLLTMSVWLGLKDYSTRLSSYDLTRMDDTLSGIPVAVYMYLNDDGKPIVFSSMGDMINIIGVYRRPVELGILARGIEDRMNRPVQFFNIRKSGYKAATDIGNPQERNKTATLYSLPDFLFFTKVVLSLLVILFAYDTIAGERERGTLQLILSNSVSRGQTLLGKFLGGYLSIALPFLAAAVIALLAACPFAIRSPQWRRLATDFQPVANVTWIPRRVFLHRIINFGCDKPGSDCCVDVPSDLGCFNAYCPKCRLARRQTIGAGAFTTTN